MELVKDFVQERTNPFTAFVSYSDLQTRHYRAIRDNDHVFSRVQLNNDALTVLGEDPRPFTNPSTGKRYVLTTHVPLNNIPNSQINVVDLETGHVERYMVTDPPHFPYGKNWSPFYFNDQLYMIHGFNPLQILKNGKLIMRVPNNTPYTDNFARFRGGSGGIQRGDRIFGVGHSTIYVPEVHRPTLWVIDTKKNTMEIAEIEPYQARFPLADSTSLWTQDGQTYAAIFESSEGWYKMQIRTAERIWRVDLDALYAQMPAWPTYTVIHGVYL